MPPLSWKGNLARRKKLNLQYLAIIRNLKRGGFIISVRFQLPNKMFKVQQNPDSYGVNWQNRRLQYLSPFFPAGSCRFAKPFLHSWDEARNSEYEWAFSCLSCISDQGEFPSLVLHFSLQHGSDKSFCWNMRVLGYVATQCQVNLRLIASSPIQSIVSSLFITGSIELI